MEDIMQRERATFTLDKEVIGELNSIAKELHLKKSHIIERALIIYFDYLDVEIAKKRLADKNDAVIPAEDVWNELGLTE